MDGVSERGCGKKVLGTFVHDASSARWERKSTCWKVLSAEEERFSLNVKDFRVNLFLITARSQTKFNSWTVHWLFLSEFLTNLNFNSFIAFSTCCQGQQSSSGMSRKCLKIHSSRGTFQLQLWIKKTNFWQSLGKFIKNNRNRFARLCF